MADPLTFSDIFPPWAQIVLFPIIAMALWTLLFNSRSSRFSKIFIEGGYLIFAIPLIVLTFLSIPMIAVMFWARSTVYAQQISMIFLGAWIGVSLILEYYFIKRTIKRIEEREQMSIWDVIRRDMSKEERAKSEKLKQKNVDEARDFFSEITDLNREKRELDREAKEKLRRALLEGSE